MSASGKSSNRHSEYACGYRGGGGHGIYASWGRADRAAADRRHATAIPRTDLCSQHAAAAATTAGTGHTARTAAVGTAVLAGVLLTVRALRR